MNRKDCRVLSVLFLIPVFFLSGTVLSGQTFFMRDLIYLFHPWRSLAGQMIQAGEFPLWNPYAMGGMPFLANCQSAILYPLSLVFWPIGFAPALKLFHWLHYGMAAGGFYLLARGMKVRPAAAFIGALVFAFNGYMLTRLEFLSVLGSVVWFPWLALLGGSIGKNRSSLTWIALGLALSAAFLSGYPQVFLLGALAAFAFSIVTAPTGSVILHWIKGGTLFLACCAVQLAPTLELIRNSVRGGGGIALKEASTYALPIDGLLGLVYPFRILHHPDRFTGEKYFWIWSGWWGIVATILIASAVFFKKRGGRSGWIFPAVLALAGIAWAMGDQLPLFEFLHRHVALIRLFRYPPVALYWTVIGAAILVLWAGRAVSGSERIAAGTKKWLMAAFAAAILIELQFYSRNILPTVPDDFYRAGFQSVRSAQAGDGTAMLSPKVNSVRRIPGRTEDQAMLRFRAFLFDLTNLPYRIRSIVPSGEPLALASYHRLYAQLESAGSLQNARPTLNLWNVTHLLTEDKLDATWEIADPDPELKVYRNPQALGLSYGFGGAAMNAPVPDSTTRPQSIRTRGSRWNVKYESNQDLKIVFNTPDYPGWKIYDGAGSRLEPIRVQDYFLGTSIPAGSRDLFLVYDSTAFKTGLIFSLCGLISLAAKGFKSARKLSRYV